MGRATAEGPMNCQHCGLPRDANYCWSCGPTTEDMNMTMHEGSEFQRRLEDAKKFKETSLAIDGALEKHKSLSAERVDRTWALFERMQGEIAREIRNMLGEPPYDQKLFDAGQKQRRIDSLKAVAADPRNESDRHEAWREMHVALGWTQGPEFKPEIKQHTNLVPFGELPATTQSKVRIFDICAKYAQAVAADDAEFKTEYVSEGL